MTRLCRLADLPDPGSARFEMPDHPYDASLCVVRSGGQVHGYVNSCPHTGAPMDWVPGQFLSEDGRYIQCSLHGALFEPDTGRCVAGPCRGDRLTPVSVTVQGDDLVREEHFGDDT